MPGFFLLDLYYLLIYHFIDLVTSNFIDLVIYLLNYVILHGLF